MSSLEDKEKHSRRRKRNLIAKELKENKFYRQRIKKPKITEEDIKKINLKNIGDFIDG